MTRNIEKNSIISLCSNNTKTSFRIENLVGIGGSCIAYRVSYKENEDIVHFGILKEFCPAYLAESKEFRRDNGRIVVPEEFSAQYEDGLLTFKNTYKTINDYLSQNLTASNYHTVQLGLYEGNNTLYTLTSCDYGHSYDKIADESFLSILKIVLATTKAVELYHNAGYLHLDIKPKNILVLEDVKDLVKLFDFDSLTPLSAIKSRSIQSIPIPEDYYVPELVNGDLRSIGISTDIFEIGAMLYSRLFGTAPSIENLSYDTEYCFESSAYLNSISPLAKHELEKLFKKTIQISHRKRYSTTKELREHLERLISLVSEEKPYLIDLPKWQPSSRRVGRKDELKIIKQLLDVDGYVFIKGMGGLGKSELAKLYAQQYASEYHTVQFCKYTDSLKTMIASLQIQGINDSDYTDFEQLVKDKNKVLHSCERHTLIIVDNYNVSYDEFMREFLPASSSSFKVIFTTRCTQAADYYDSKTYELPPLSNDECKELFALHSGGIDGDTPELEQLIESVDRNTLILILLASTIKRSGLSVLEMQEVLKKQTLDKVETKIFHEYDYSAEEANAYNKVLSHLYSIFSISNLSDTEKELMKNMSLVSTVGIDLDLFLSYCDYDNAIADIIHKLADENWMNLAEDNTASLHPTVSDLVAWDERVIKAETYYKLAENLENECQPDYSCHFSVLLNKLECACHLERRYVNENDEMQIYISFCLGRLYENMYRYEDAVKCFNSVLKRATENNYPYFIPYTYKALGDIEKEFGTLSNAIEYYRKAYVAGTDDSVSNYSTALDSITCAAKCHFENKANEKAYKMYVEALEFAKKHSLTDSIYDIATEIIEVCKDMDWDEKIPQYEELCNQYSKKVDTSDDLLSLEKISQMSSTGAWEDVLKTFEEFLYQKRIELGEDSPVYKDLAHRRWMFYIVNHHKEQGLRLLSETLGYIEKTYGANSMEMARQLATVVKLTPLIGEFDYALQAADRAIQICDDNNEVNSFTKFETILSKSNCYLLMCQHNKAKECLESVDFNMFLGNEAFSEIVASAGLILCEASRYDEAEKICVDYLSRKNTSEIITAQANIILSIVEEQKGNLLSAEHHSELAKEYIDSLADGRVKNDWFLQYYRSRARIAFRKLDYITAISELDTIISLFDDVYNEPLLYGVFVERALYNDMIGRSAEADRDFETCEKILSNNNMPKDCYAILYNNISIRYINNEEYETAMVHLNKLLEIKPEVVSPISYFDAIACGNVGWCSYNLGKVDYGFQLLDISAKCFERIGAIHTKDYLSTKHNSALAHILEGNPQIAAEIYEELYSVYADSMFDFACEFRRKMYRHYLRSLFDSKQAKKAYDFSLNEIDYFKQIFGITSLEYIDVCTEIGLLFKGNGFTDCKKFYSIALDAANEGQHRNTTIFAVLLNAIGTYLTDFEKEHELARNYFYASKELFEDTESTDNKYYPYVISNIEYINKLIQDND